jgi:tetratricopeptide (TPR) repeat protein
VLAHVARAQDDDERALALAGEGLTIKREIGDVEGIAWSLSNLGGIALDGNDLGRAQERFDEALDLFRRLGNRSGVASTLCNLGAIATRQGDGSRGRPLLRESLAMFADLDDPGGIACVFDEVARLRVLDGRIEQAASLLGASAALREVTGEAPLPATQVSLDQTQRIVRAGLDAHGFAAAWTKGRLTPMQQMVAEILSGD